MNYKKEINLNNKNIISLCVSLLILLVFYIVQVYGGSSSIIHIHDNLDSKITLFKVLKDNERQLFEIHRIKTDVLIAELIDQKK